MPKYTVIGTAYIRFELDVVAEDEDGAFAAAERVLVDVDEPDGGIFTDVDCSCREAKLRA
jgi:hypothetical protein